MSSIATTNETSNVTSLPTAPKPQTSKEVIAANVKLLIEQLEAGPHEGLTASLPARGKFHNYSFGNILEIARQMPSASRVAGLYAWNQLGRRVKKGQKGIRILAPMLGTKRKKDSEAERSTPGPTRLNPSAAERTQAIVFAPHPQNLSTRPRRAIMQNSSAFQFLALDTIHESTTNPRRTFEESKLHELAESIRQHGLIQPITVRPNSEGFEIVAGARRFRAAQLAELFASPARIVELTDAQALEWALVENACRVDVHPYEEAEGFRRLLDIPGYDVATLVEKSGKSASHIYARLSLLQLIPEVAWACPH